MSLKHQPKELGVGGSSGGPRSLLRKARDMVCALERQIWHHVQLAGGTSPSLNGELSRWLLA